jgi:hypothetical protein
VHLHLNPSHVQEYPKVQNDDGAIAKTTNVGFCDGQAALLQRASHNTVVELTLLSVDRRLVGFEATGKYVSFGNSERTVKDQDCWKDKIEINYTNVSFVY